MTPQEESLHGLPDFLRPTLRLFLSVDIVGSTAFKQSSTKPGSGHRSGGGSRLLAAPWLEASTQFYKEIERLFTAAWASQSKDHQDTYSWPAGTAPQLWKSAGDELIYTKELSDHRQTVCCIQAWIKTVTSFAPELKKFSKSLDLKCTAWLAGFPVTNSEVILRSSLAHSQLAKDSADEDDAIVANFKLLEQYKMNPEGLIRDYIGPSIDTGFRLATLSTPRKFVISLDLALMLAYALVAPAQDTSPMVMNLHYSGKETLKGVFDGVPYPIFWIDVSPEDRLNRFEDTVTGDTAISVIDVREFCREFIGRIGEERIIRPYVVGNPDTFFGVIPQNHLDRLKSYSDYWSNEKKKREVEQDTKDPGPPQKNGNAIEEALKLLGPMIVKMIGDPSKK